MIARPDVAAVLRSWVAIVKRRVQSNTSKGCWTHPRLRDTKTCRTRGVDVYSVAIQKRVGTRTINDVRRVLSGMATEEGAEPTSPLDDAIEDIRRELVRRVAADDRDSNRDVYDALEDE